MVSWTKLSNSCCSTKLRKSSAFDHEIRQLVSFGASAMQEGATRLATVIANVTRECLLEPAEADAIGAKLRGAMLRTPELVVEAQNDGDLEISADADLGTKRVLKKIAEACRLVTSESINAASAPTEAVAPAGAAGRPHSPSTAELVVFGDLPPTVQCARVYLKGIAVAVMEAQLIVVDDEYHVLGVLDANDFDPQDLGTLKSIATGVAKHESAEFSYPQKVCFLRHFLTFVVKDFGVSQAEVGRLCVEAFEHADGVKPINQSVVSGIMSGKVAKRNARESIQLLLRLAVVVQFLKESSGLAFSADSLTSVLNVQVETKKGSMGASFARLRHAFRRCPAPRQPSYDGFDELVGCIQARVISSARTPPGMLRSQQSRCRRLKA